MDGSRFNVYGRPELPANREITRSYSVGHSRHSSKRHQETTCRHRQRQTTITMMPRILAVDLGNKTGLAWNYGDEGATTLWLSTPKEVRDWGQARLTRTCDPRISRLYQHLSGRCKDGLDIVVFEDVQFSTYTAQTQLWSSFRSALWLACKAHARIECVPVTTLKKFA